MNILLLVLFALIGCTSNKKALTLTETLLKDKEACFLIYNMKTNTFDTVVGEEMCKKSYPAFSSFKVPLAVMAFDSGAIKDENQVLKWDKVKNVREVANKDHDAKTWMRDSIVWFSQRITTRMGAAKFQKYLNDFDYGNKDFSEGLTTAWLTSPATGKGLMITPYGQIEFMKKLWRNELPVSQRSMDLTKKITFIDTSPNGFKLSGKTGSNYFDEARKVRMGWFISHLQKDDQEYVTVTNFRDLAPSDDTEYGGLRAKDITIKLLSEKGLW